jgi:GNAT superfamily N-acetyltransferase
MEDVELLLPLIENYYEFDHIPFDREQMQLPLEQLLRDPALGQGWLVVVEDKIIGYALLTFGFDLEFGGRQATLTDLYLQQDYRRQGIGRQTLQFIEETSNTE